MNVVVVVVVDVVYFTARRNQFRLANDEMERILKEAVARSQRQRILLGLLDIRRWER